MKWVVGWAVLATLAAALLARGAIQADARADAASALWEASDSTFQAYKDSASVELASQSAAIDRLETDARASRARADSTAAERQPVTAAVDDILPTLPDSARRLIQRQRELFDRQVAALERAGDSLTLALTVSRRKDATRAALLARTEQRLAEALRGWQAAERARRPGPLAYVTRGLALVGAVVLVDRGACSLASVEVLLPCGR